MFRWWLFGFIGLGALLVAGVLIFMKRLQKCKQGKELFKSVENGRLVQTSNLLINGANIELCNEKGLTLLMCAVVNYRPGIVKTLLDYGANPMKKDKEGRTAMDLAKEAENEEIIAILKKYDTYE